MLLLLLISEILKILGLFLLLLFSNRKAIFAANLVAAFAVKFTLCGILKCVYNEMEMACYNEKKRSKQASIFLFL